MLRCWIWNLKKRLKNHILRGGDSRHPVVKLSNQVIRIHSSLPLPSPSPSPWRRPRPSRPPWRWPCWSTFLPSAPSQISSLPSSRVLRGDSDTRSRRKCLMPLEHKLEPHEVEKLLIKGKWWREVVILIDQQVIDSSLSILTQLSKGCIQIRLLGTVQEAHPQCSFEVASLVFYWYLVIWLNFSWIHIWLCSLNKNIYLVLQKCWW